MADRASITAKELGAMLASILMIRRKAEKTREGKAGEGR
jgi:hypothetical protein